MLEILPATTDDELAHIARIAAVVWPASPISVDEMRWQEQKYPGGRRFIAWLDGEPVGAGGAGRAYSFPPDFPGFWSNLSVLPEHRRQGIGSALLAAISDVARDAGKTMLLGTTTSDRADSIDFLEHRGFREHERMKVVKLDLAGIVPPAIEPPPGVTISSLEAHPDLVPSVYDVAQEALPDIPGDGPEAPATLEEFRTRDVDRAIIPAGGFVIAIDDATGRVAGYANLMLVPGRATVAWHGMTAVARAWRGRGLARALKAGTIAWALDNGLEALEGSNDIDNAPMRAVNKRLGYQPEPDEIQFRGPLA
jgi:GNAT superfamily N-acetyltransferase